MIRLWMREFLEKLRLCGQEGSSARVSMEECLVQDKQNARCLLMVSRDMEFLPLDGSAIVKTIPFPVAVWVSDSTLTIHVLTMQSSLKAWGEILGEDLKRILTPVRADPLHDAALGFLAKHDVPVGAYVDYSKRAIQLMKSARADTFSGTYEVGTAGSTKHDTLRQNPPKPLRTSMPEEYEKLVSARKIVNCQVQLNGEHLGLPSGAKVALYPTTGKISFRSNLQGSDPDEFVSAMASQGLGLVRG